MKSSFSCARERHCGWVLRGLFWSLYLMSGKYVRRLYEGYVRWAMRLTLGAQKVRH